jgi:hypothetical protein
VEFHCSIGAPLVSCKSIVKFWLGVSLYSCNLSCESMSATSINLFIHQINVKQTKKCKKTNKSESSMKQNFCILVENILLLLLLLLSLSFNISYCRLIFIVFFLFLKRFSLHIGKKNNFRATTVNALTPKFLYCWNQSFPIGI